MTLFRRIIFLIYLFPLQVFGNPIIINQGTGKPINQVEVYDLKREMSVFSDRKGDVDLSQFGNEDTLFFYHPSYNSITLTTKQAKSIKHLPLIKKNIQLEEFIISANKRKEKKSEVAKSMDVIETDQLILSSSTNSADVLMSTGNIAVQKSQGGGGSPILRGFEANKILLVLDGVRMNNAIYRSGHLQNSLTIDNEILERVEVVYGPGSVMYGSDALGGVIHYKTIDPEFALNEKLNFKAGVKFQVSTPTLNNIKHAHVNVGLKKVALLTSVTQKDLGDIMMGKARSPLMENYGRLYHFPERKFGKDYTTINDNPNLQIGTGYTQTDLIQKIRIRSYQHHDITLNFQYSTSSDIPRYERLSKYSKNGDLKYAEWYYGPQNRLLAALDYRYTNPNLIFNDARLIVAYQKIDEDRFKRKTDDLIKKIQNEDVYVYTANLDFYKKINEKSNLIYGAELSYNKVRSTAYEYNITNLARESYPTRYPDGNNYTTSISGYANYKTSINDKLIFSAGARYSYYTLQIGYDSISPQYFVDFAESKSHNQALTGSLSLIYNYNPFWRFNVLLSSGFRNPNIDDVGKIRDLGNDLIIPNSNVKPEYAYNFEFGTSRTFIGLFRVNATVFGNLLTNAIVRKSVAFNGADSVFYDDETFNLQVNDNANIAMVYGISASIESDFNEVVAINSSLNYTQGKNLTDNVPLGHIPPVYGRTGIKLHLKKTTQELYSIYNGWKHFKDFSPEGEDKNEEAFENYGFPAWGTLNYNLNYLLGKNVNFQFSVQNILDQFYKPYASGVAGMGRTFTFGIRLNF